MGAFKLLDFSTERYILPEEVIFLAVLRPYVIIHIAVNGAIIIWYTCFDSSRQLFAILTGFGHAYLPHFMLVYRS